MLRDGVFSGRFPWTVAVFVLSSSFLPLPTTRGGVSQDGGQGMRSAVVVSQVLSWATNSEWCFWSE